MRGVATNHKGGAEARIYTGVVTLARNIDRRVGREELDRLAAANDNAPATERQPGLMPKVGFTNNASCSVENNLRCCRPRHGRFQRWVSLSSIRRLRR